MNTLYGDFHRALLEVQRGDQLRRWLDGRGLTAERRRRVGGVGVARATLTKSTMTWEPNSDGEKVLVVPVWDGPAFVDEGPHRHPSPLIDLVAWRQHDARTLYLRLGSASVLGVEGLRIALDTASPVRVFRSVEDYIRSGGEASGEYPAAVLLNVSFALFHLGNLPAVVADDLEHGVELESVLHDQRPNLPPIRIPATVEAAA